MKRDGLTLWDLCPLERHVPNQNGQDEEWIRSILGDSEQDRTGVRDALVEFPKLRVLTRLEFSPLGIRQWRRKEIDSWRQDGPGPLALWKGHDPRKGPPCGRQDREALLGGHFEGARHASYQILLRLSRLRSWFRGKGPLPHLFGGHEVIIDE